MRIRLRDIDPDDKFAPQVRLAALARIMPQALLQEVLAEAGVITQRKRKLTFEAILWLTVAMNLFPELSIDHVFEKMTSALRFLWPDEEQRHSLLPSRSAVCQRRYQLGVRSMARLFRRVCRPMATPGTPGAFFRGLRLMGIDGHIEDVPDSAANARIFGRHGADRGVSAFPQVLMVTLCELGTHALVDVAFRPALIGGEHPGSRTLLRSLSPEMLVLWDRGLHEYALIEAVRERGAHVLERLPNNIKPVRVRSLPDGSWLGELLHPDPRQRREGARLQVRIIEYTFTDPQSPGYKQRYRILTTLLDPKEYPAHCLAGLYHERWEIEITYDETDTHQRQQHLMTSPLRSRRPTGVIQELYGLLLAHYAIRYLMHEAALLEGLDPDRLSFVHALQVVQDALWQFQISDAQLWPALYQRLLRDVAQGILPEREPRNQPRAVRRKMVRYPVKRLEHKRWPQPTQPYARSIALI